MDLDRQTAWLNRTENGTSRGVPLNVDAVAVLKEQGGNHPEFCFAYRGATSWHRQAGTSCDELKDLGGWKSRNMVDRYAKCATENVAVTAARIEQGKQGKPETAVTSTSRSEMTKGYVRT